MPHSRRHITDVYISHGSDLDHPEWFVVKPSAEDGMEAEVRALLDAQRTVYHIMAKPRLTARLMRKAPIRLKPTGIAPIRSRQTTEERGQ